MKKRLYHSSDLFNSNLNSNSETNFFIESEARNTNQELFTFRLLRDSFRGKIREKEPFRDDFRQERSSGNVLQVLQRSIRTGSRRYTGIHSSAPHSDRRTAGYEAYTKFAGESVSIIMLDGQ
jgi:hypothetical protein